MAEITIRSRKNGPHLIHGPAALQDEDLARPAHDRPVPLPAACKGSPSATAPEIELHGI